MKRFLKAVCFILVAAIAFFAVACGDNKGINDSGELGGDANGSEVGFIVSGDSGTSSGEITTSAVEREIADAIADDLGALSGDTDPTDATQVGETEETFEIKTAGDYVLSGNYPAGVIVKKGAGVVHIYLNNANISSDSDSAISVKKNNSVIITVAEGTTNIVTSNGKNGIDSNSPISINGTGALTVVSTAKNGVKVDNSLTIVDASIEVTAVNQAISAYSVNAKDCTLIVKTENDGEAKDGIHAEMEDPASTDDISSLTWTADDGYIILNNVNYTANVEGDGLQADTFIYINGGTYDITTTAEFVAYSSANMTTYGLTKDDFRYRLVNGVYYKQAADSQVSSGSYAMIQSSKGIKVGEIDYEVEDDDGNIVASGEISDGNYYIIIEGGTFTIDSADDAIHTNSGNLTINGGDFAITTLDDGLASDGTTKIQGGSVTVNYCYEGIEGSCVEINGGSIKLNYCLDDGINAASDYINNEYIKITGGNIYVNAYGDGIDSNGGITISGGTIFVDGPSDGGNGSIDSDTGIVIDGGYLVAVGSSAWVREATPKTTSTQCSLVYAGSTVAAGTTLTLKDADGNAVLSFKTAKSSSSVVMSSPDVVSGSSYTLYAGSTLIATFNVSSVVTSVGTSSGGGMGGPGGMGGRPNFK